MNSRNRHVFHNPMQFHPLGSTRKKRLRPVDSVTQRLNDGLELLEMEGALDDTNDLYDEPWWMQRPLVVIQSW